MVHRPAELGTVGQRRPARRDQPHHAGKERGGGRTRDNRPQGVDEPALRAGAALHPQEPASRRCRRGRRLLRLHLSRTNHHAHRRALSHVGPRRHVARAGSRCRADDSGRRLRHDRCLERRYRHPRRPDRRPALSWRVARDPRETRFTDGSSRRRRGLRGSRSRRATRCSSTADASASWRRAGPTPAATARG